jgi:endonuclease/exonuclease/phosphatase family metal-dependent hydrolase
MRRLLITSAILLVSAACAVEIRVATFNIGAHFGETYFDYSLGEPGTPDHDSVRDILARIDADVVALQEIHSVDLLGAPDDLSVLVASLGYAYQYVPPTTGAFDTTLRAVILSRFPFLSATAIGSPPGAREITRLHPMVKVDVPETANDPVLISPHLKAGTTQADRFRRAVEMKRLTAALSAAGLTNDDNFVVLGDFNPSSTSLSFPAAPSGLPDAYVLGNDIPFPVSYSTDPLDYFTSPSAVRLDPRQLDGSPSTYGTTAPNGPVLDLILVSPAIAGRPHAGEIYHSTLDVSNAAGLPKAGDPLAATTSATASDHFAVFADLELDPDDPYGLLSPGQTVTENFDGFAGTRNPAHWAMTGGLSWRGTDDGSSSVPGWRAYGPAEDRAPGFLTGGAAASAVAVYQNQSAVPITALEVSLDAEQWRAVTNGAADGLNVEIQTAGQTIALPGLSFTASQSLPTGPVAGAAVTPLSALATGLTIPPGASFALRVSFLPGTNGGPLPADVFVNEFHYDNTGTDTGEFVEIAVAPGFSGDLSDISLVLYNGGTGGSYGTHSLETFTPGTTTASGHRLFSKPIAGLQNDVEGFAVVVDSVVLHFISYEGSLTAADGPALGMTSVNIGVSQGGSDPLGQASLGLTGTGASAADFPWLKSSGAHTPGQENTGQSFILPAAAPQGLAFDRVSVTFLADHDQDGQPDGTDPDDDNDGQTDADETAFGTDPLDPASRFQPVLARSSTPPHGFELTFPGAPGFLYTVQTSEALGTWQDLSSHTGAGQSIVVPLPMDLLRRFFRVRSGD